MVSQLLTAEFWPSHVSVWTCSRKWRMHGAHVGFCCSMYTNSTRLILQLVLGHYSESEIRYSKHFPLQSSFLLCFVATIVSISYFQSLISVSALSSCLYMSPNRVEALMAGLKTVGSIMTKCEEGKSISIDLGAHEIWPVICEIAFISKKLRLMVTMTRKH